VKRVLCMAVILLGTVAALAADPPDDAKAIQGDWVPVKAELAGQAQGEAFLKAIRMKLVDGRYEVVVGEQPDKGTYTLDPAAKPKGLTVTGVDGPNKGRMIPAIYELQGDTLRVCYDLSGAKRPEEFKSAAGTQSFLVTYRRVLDDQALLQGEWAMVSGQSNGTPIPEDLLRTGRRMARGDETTILIGGQVYFKARFTLDATKKPKTIDYTITEGPTKGERYLGIYELAADTVKFCFAAAGKERPTDFTAAEGSERTLSVWKREKK
jgi:uncharacterized protein (TIGR03067 family)